MIEIYTQNLFFPEKTKELIKKLLNRQTRGPMAVLVSLADGLKELKQNFEINKRPNPSVDLACVVSGAKTLKWAIRQKRQGKIKKIIAGPNIIVFPDDENGVLRDPLVDIVIVPSLWVKDLYVKLAPEIENRIRIWPAGVNIPALKARQKEIDFLVYDKSPQGINSAEVVKYLKEHNYSYSVLQYGKFRQADYFKELERCKFEIYLSQSESQGLAMFEAWARDVPTLVWESGLYDKRGVAIRGLISAPYLNPALGASFAGMEDIGQSLEAFTRAAFPPRSYTEQNFSNKVCAQKYLDIIYGS